MKRRFFVLSGVGILLLALILCSCKVTPQENVTLGATTEPVPATAPTTVPTTAPPPPEPVEVTLEGTGPEEVLALLEVENLVYVDATASTSYDALMELMAAKPDCVMDYFVDLGGIVVGNMEETADIRGAEISSETLGKMLRYLPNLRSLDMCDLDYTNEESLSVIEAYPQIDFTWTVNFGAWSVRSDIQVFSSLQYEHPKYRYTSEDFFPLFHYCTDLVALDVGHNALTDLSELTNLKNLQVLIIADNPTITDITPLGELTGLYYLEIFMDWRIEDFTPLGNLTKMVDLNACTISSMENVDFLDNMPDLKMGWFIGTGITHVEMRKMREEHPDAKFVFDDGGTSSSTCAGWRATDRNIAIRTAFKNWPLVVSFKNWDEIEYQEGADIQKAVASYV